MRGYGGLDQATDNIADTVLRPDVRFPVKHCSVEMWAMCGHYSSQTESRCKHSATTAWRRYVPWGQLAPSRAWTVLKLCSHDQACYGNMMHSVSWSWAF